MKLICVTKCSSLHDLIYWHDWLVSTGSVAYYVRSGAKFKLCRGITDRDKTDVYCLPSDYRDETTATATKCNCFAVPGMVVDVPVEKVYTGRHVHREFDKLELVSIDRKE